MQNRANRVGQHLVYGADILVTPQCRHTANMDSFNFFLLGEALKLGGNQVYIVPRLYEVFAKKVTHPAASTAYRGKLVVKHQNSHI